MARNNKSQTAFLATNRRVTARRSLQGVRPIWRGPYCWVGAAASFNVDHTRSAIMIVAVLTMLVLILIFGAEVGWLCRA